MEQVSTTRQSESRSESAHAATLASRTERQGVTETEIEIYDTAQPPDSATGRPPVKARIRQRHDQQEQTLVEATEAGHEKAETAARDTVSNKSVTLDEVTVTATKEPGLWDRLKQCAAWAAAIMILAAAGWITIKLIKRKKI